VIVDGSGDGGRARDTFPEADRGAACADLPKLDGELASPSRLHGAEDTLLLLGGKVGEENLPRGSLVQGELPAEIHDETDLVRRLQPLHGDALESDEEVQAHGLPALLPEIPKNWQGLGADVQPIHPGPRQLQNPEARSVGGPRILLADKPVGGQGLQQPVGGGLAQMYPASDLRDS
jgi:hypothetical protein